jgi:sulfite reductase (NADPH) hemoprotein beta-component
VAKLRILKSNLRTAIKGINSALLTTLGACGDVNRNVMCSSIPTRSRLHFEAYEAAKAISDQLLPSTSAYHEVALRDE